MFEIKSFCFDVVMCDLLHDVRAIYLRFPVKNSYFRKDFQMLFAVKEGGIQIPDHALGQI